MNHPIARAMAAMALSCCALAGAAQNPSSVPAPVASCTTCGTIEAIRYVEQKGQASGVGAVTGGIVGGVVGHQIGSGRGNTVATIAGVGVGALAGNEVEKNVKKKSYYVVTVRLDNGNKQSLTQGSKPALKEGDRVKIVDGNRLALLAN